MTQDNKSKNFWSALPNPFFVLAPLADVTDAAFRRIVAKYGKPDVLWTEFVSADGLILGGEKAQAILLDDLKFTEPERPIVAQLFTSNPETMKEAAKLVASLGFDGLDINMGCPDRSIEKQGAGAAMIKNPEQALLVIEAAKSGAPELPLSVKTRTGYYKDELESWLPVLLDAGLAAITVHARTRKDMSKVAARWENIKEAVDLRNKMNSNTLIIGNGDVQTLEEGEGRVKDTSCDGIMIGRGIFGNPWCFNRNIDRDRDISISERLRVMVEHTKLFEKLLPHKNFAIMKKHYKAYVTGWDGAKELRLQLMNTKNADEVEKIVKAYPNV